MNKIISKCLLTGETFTLDDIQNSQYLLLALVDHSLNIVKEFKNLEKQEI